ncbi:MAG: peptidoglycan-binding domain-containing protein [Pseudomonadota bacterium]
MSLIRVRFLTLVAVAMFASVSVNLFALQGTTETRATASVRTNAAHHHVSGGAATLSEADTVLTSAPQPSLAAHGGSAEMNGTVVAIQRELVAKGYAPGAADGVAGMTTRAAIFAYQHDHGLPLTADATDDVLEALILGLPKVPGGAVGALGPHAERLVRTVQSALTGLGLPTGGVDGRLGPMTRSAIQQFEVRNGLVPSGRVSADIIRALGQTRITGHAKAG